MKNSSSTRSCIIVAIAHTMQCLTRKIDGRIGDKYQLSAVLGQGATGTVYAAKNLRTQRRIAIKSLHLRPGLNPGCPELLRFEQEARITGSIESPHLVQILDVEHDPATDLPFLVMELLRARTCSRCSIAWGHCRSTWRSASRRRLARGSQQRMRRT
jgi:serine/threonine protein kinase